MKSLTPYIGLSLYHGELLFIATSGVKLDTFYFHVHIQLNVDYQGLTGMNL